MSATSLLYYTTILLFLLYVDYFKSCQQLRKIVSINLINIHLELDQKAPWESKKPHNELERCRIR